MAQNQTPNTNPDPIDPSQPNSPFFIGANDNSGALLVTQMLDSNNYHFWARSIRSSNKKQDRIH